MLLRTGRAGAGSTLGHDLTIELAAWSAKLDAPAANPAEAHVTARIELTSLAVSEGSGGAVPLSDKDRAEIGKNAKRTLDVDRHPTATFESRQVALGQDQTTISGVLTLHGVAAPVDIDVREVEPGRYRATTVITQSEYGIKPYSAFLGALKVRDDVGVEIEVDLRPAHRSPSG